MRLVTLIFSLLILSCCRPIDNLCNLEKGDLTKLKLTNEPVQVYSTRSTRTNCYYYVRLSNGNRIKVKGFEVENGMKKEVEETKDEIDIY